MKTFLMLCAAMLATMLPLAQARGNFELELAQLAVQSDLIVVGTITEVLDKTVTVRMSKVIAGEWKEETLVYYQYSRNHEIACCPSWDLYKEDQEFVLFLKAIPPDDPNETGAQFYDAGDLGRGEMPVDGKVAYTKHINVGIPTKEYQLQNNTYYCSEVNLAELLDAITVLRECFELTKDGTLQANCSDEELKRAAEISDLLAHAIERATKPQNAKK